MAAAIAANLRAWNLVSTEVSHYDPDSNRCYAETYMNGQDTLYDAQTEEVLAQLWTSGSEVQNYIKGGPGHPSDAVVRDFINRRMADTKR